MNPARKRTLRNLMLFTLCILLFPWLGVWLDVQGGNDPHNQQQSLGWLLFILTPVATLLLLRLFAGDGWQDFGLKPVFRGNGKWYLFAFFFHPLSMALLLALGLALGVTQGSQLTPAMLGLAGQALAAAFIPSFIKNIFEEFAWRGYLTPKVQSLLKNQLLGHLLVGVIWFSWHIPYYLFLLSPEILQSATSLSLGWFLVLSFLGILPTAILYGELRLRTGSVWPAVLIHTCANIFFDTLAMQKIFRFPNALAEGIFSPALYGLLVILLNLGVGLWLYRTRLQASSGEAQLKYALLGALNYQSMSGYDLKQFTDRSTSHFWHAELSQIYVTLKALEKEGLITSASIPQTSRPDRRVYTLTESGKQALNAWLKTPFTEIDQYKDTLLLKLFFSASQGKEAILAQLRLQRSLHQNLVDQFQTETANLIAQTVEHAPQLRQDALLWEATRRFGELTELAYLTWLDETLHLIETQFEKPA